MTCCARWCSTRQGAPVSWRLGASASAGARRAHAGTPRWKQAGGWSVANPTHTLHRDPGRRGMGVVDSTTAETRHVGIMVDGPTSRLHKHALVEDLPVAARATPRTWPSSSCRHTRCPEWPRATHRSIRPRIMLRRGFVLVGDAGCTLNPLVVRASEGAGVRVVCGHCRAHVPAAS